MDRRVVLLSTYFFFLFGGCTMQDPPSRKPQRIRTGDTVGLISPASPYIYLFPNETYIPKIKSDMHSLGLKIIYGKHMNEVYGYLAGIDGHRADDVNFMFSNDSVQLILANRGGFGCDRILELLDYDMIAKNPKIILGYSDITALLNAIHFKTGLITFYGPMGIDNWQNLNSFYVKQIIFNAKAILLSNPSNMTLNLTTITGGKARGKLVGGNLSVFNTLLNSQFLPSWINWASMILFLEDTEEQPYTIDRMLTTLTFAGVLRGVGGVIWGTCSKCEPPDPEQSLTMIQVLEHHFKPLNVPVFVGSMIGHIEEQFTLPIGIEVEMDADLGTIQMLEPAVL